MITSRKSSSETLGCGLSQYVEKKRERERDPRLPSYDVWMIGNRIAGKRSSDFIYVVCINLNQFDSDSQMLYREYCQLLLQDKS